MNKNILITSAGKRVNLTKAFQTEAKKIDNQIKIYTCDSNPKLAPACYISDKVFTVPKIQSANYIKEIKDLCLKEKIGIIIPTIDTELEILSMHRNYLLENNITPIISDLDFISVCRDKRATNNFFVKQQIHIPQQYTLNNIVYPVFIKPYDGSRSIDTHILTQPNQLKNMDLSNNKYMFMEYLNSNEYDEYTIDMYFDKFSELKCMVPRKRIEIRSGEINKGITLKNNVYEYIYHKLQKIVGARGCITLQVFVNKHNANKIYGIEINPRFGGGYPLSYYANANFPKWIIEEYLFEKEIPFFEDWEANILMLRYDEEVFIHDFYE